MSNNTGIIQHRCDLTVAPVLNNTCIMVKSALKFRFSHKNGGYLRQVSLFWEAVMDGSDDLDSIHSGRV